MASSDFGVVFNGEAVSESAALQLPVAVIENLGFFTTYYESIYNQFFVDENIALNKEIYKELISTSANPNLLGEELYNMYKDPKYKFWCATKYASTVYQQVPLAAGEDSIQHEGTTFTRHSFSYETIARKVLDSAK